MGGDIYSKWETNEEGSDQVESENANIPDTEELENKTTISSDVDNELVDPRSIPEEGE